MSGTPGRAEIIAVAIALLGLVMAARAAWRLLRAVGARFTYGAPYRHGTIGDRALGFALTLPVLLLGLGLGFLALGQAAFQPDATTVRVGQVEARRAGWGRIRVRFVPDPAYAMDRVLEGEIAGARWALAGDFISWDRNVRWLGLRDGHRLRYLLATRDSTGTTPEARAETTALEPLPRIARALVAAAPWLPFLEVKRLASPWFAPADLRVMVLYATGAGYLAEAASATRAAAPAAIDSGRRAR